MTIARTIVAYDRSAIVTYDRSSRFALGPVALGPRPEDPVVLTIDGEQ